jgi:hypothetical protein
VRPALPSDPSWPRYTRRAFPSYRYLPGDSPHPRRDPLGHGYGRPAPGAERCEPERWHACETYLFGIDLYNFAYFWECHEQLEALFAGAPRNALQRRFLKGLIQAAASHLKWVAEAPAPATRLARRALLALEDTEAVYMGVDTRALREALRARVGDPGAPPAPIGLRR